MLKRRTFLKVAATTPLVSVPFVHAARRDQPLVIDCHAHIYGTDEKAYPTIEKPYRPPKGKGTIAHLKKEMANNRVKYVTAIQTSTYYRWDNRFTADSAKKYPDWMVAVVTMNPDDADSPDKLAKYVRKSNVRGMRSIPGEAGKFDDAGVAALWKQCEASGIVVNVLTNAGKLGEVTQLMKRYPKLRVVIDHCFNIAADDKQQATVEAVTSLAKFPQVHAKLTFIPTGSKQDYPCSDLHDSCREVIKAFSPQRCVWGSDFPCELWCPKLTYKQHLDIFRKELGLSDSHKEWILGKTAHKLWINRS